MKTYNTINEAFKNGSGDCFFSKDGKFVAFSRNDDRREEMEAKGFIALTHSEVLELAKARQPIKETTATAVAPNQREPKKFVNHTDMEVWGYYDEFPDAYGQHL